MYVNFNRAYPPINSRDFLKRARQKYRPGKSIEFFLWIYLCLERPWENNWKRSLSEDTFNTIYDIAREILKDSVPQPPEIGALRYHLKKKNLKSIVEINAVNPEFRKLLELLGKRFHESVPRLQKLTDAILKVSNLKLMIKFASILNSEKHVRKSDLMKRLRIDKKLLDVELKNAEKQGFIKIKKYSDGATFIVYIGPPL